MAHETILIVDDERDITELIRYNLEKENFNTITVASGEDALVEARKSLPALIILDLMLPGVDGLEVCKKLSQDELTHHIPILMLTAKSEDSDIILGLEMGADDYVTKPFSPKVLIARVRALLRRNKEKESRRKEAVIRIHGLTIDTTRHEVLCDGQLLALSVSEFSILEFLAKNPGWVFSRNQIIGAVKGEDYPVTERSVDVQILGLRKKLGPKGVCIETVRGIGYRMTEE
ncbi:MAG TPA: response regulator transcription factor [Spirochaetia bacterium]|jgi:two-component system phosphate regulon response regulator PhoB|nr:response regulator transcription factor [Spirochaetia bacterium]